jgi:radical SAM-linked protein
MTVPDMAKGRPGRTRVRLRFSKLGKVRFTSHRDIARIWERALRRAELPVAYSEGFSPRPRVSFGLALPTGHEGIGEYLDVELAGDPDEDRRLDRLAERLDPCLPVGFRVGGAGLVDPGAPSVQQAVVSCRWRMELLGVEARQAAEAIDEALTRTSLVVERPRKGELFTDDVRPDIDHLTLIGPTPAGVEVEAELTAQPRVLRPGELVSLFGPEVREGRTCRTHQWTLGADGAKVEPLPAPGGLVGWSIAATSAPHASRAGGVGGQRVMSRP